MTKKRWLATTRTNTAASVALRSNVRAHARRTACAPRAAGHDAQPEAELDDAHLGSPEREGDKAARDACKGRAPGTVRRGRSRGNGNAVAFRRRRRLRRLRGKMAHVSLPRHGRGPVTRPNICIYKQPDTVYGGIFSHCCGNCGCRRGLPLDVVTAAVS